MDGIIIINKMKGCTSHDIVYKVKKMVNEKVGHTGTLDPMASGVLPVGLGKASRLFQYMLDKEKEYLATFKFGLLTDTLDVTGTTIATSEIIPSKEQICLLLEKLTGEISQVPPNYSAKCVNGKRGYELARKGVEFTLAPKTVSVLSFTLLKQVSKDEFLFRIVCKGGTYVRSLARDLGKLSGTFAVMSALDRVRAGVFSYDNGITIDDLKGASNIERFIIKPEDTLYFEKLYLTPEREKKIVDGVFENYGFKDGVYSVFGESGFIGVGEVISGILKIKSYVKNYAKG